MQNWIGELTSIGVSGGTFLLWGLFDVVIALYAWFGLSETRGKSLEQITHDGGSLEPERLPSEEPVFDGIGKAGRANHVESANRKGAAVVVR